MPWTINNPPPPAKNWSAKKKRACVSAANAALKRGDSEEDAIYACIGAANNVKQYDEDADEEYHTLVEESRTKMMALGEDVADGRITPETFRDEMRKEVRILLVAIAILASHGTFSLDNELDVDDLELFINSTYGLLDDFYQTLREGDKSREYIVWRSGLYSAHRHAFIRYTVPRDVFLNLPAFPGISCLGDGLCGCWLEVEKTSTGYDVWWYVNPMKEHCVVCLELESEWSPLHIDV